MVSSPIPAAFVALLAAAAPLGAQIAAHDEPPPPINRFVTFGDSLSDPGNTYVATREFVVRPFDPIPSAPYLIGRFHFTNGPTWVEQLARDFRLPRSAGPALLRPGVYTNYAFGAARARPVGGFDLGPQVDGFLTDFDDIASPEALYVLWIGANDLRDAFAALEEDPTGDTSEGIILEALVATSNNLLKLWEAGARSFLVLNLPDISGTPAIRALGFAAQAAARRLSEAYNAGLEMALEQLENLPDIAIVTLDVLAILDEVVDDPDLAGLTNVTDSCITPGVVIGAICRRPRKFLFWDFIHPTKKAHEYLSEQARGSLETEFCIESRGFERYGGCWLGSSARQSTRGPRQGQISARKLYNASVEQRRARGHRRRGPRSVMADRSKRP